jgi:cellulose synthase (UDP-forming)
VKLSAEAELVWRDAPPADKTSVPGSPKATVAVRGSGKQASRNGADLPLWAVLASIAASFALMLALTIYIFWMAPISVTAKWVYYGLIGSLFYCSIAYLVNRFGGAVRSARFVRASTEQLDRLVKQDAPAVTVLIPTYREERRVLLLTILSAALARYTQRRIVVLVDDPPDSPSLPHTLATVHEAMELLAEPMAPLKGAFIRWQQRRAHGGINARLEAEQLVQHFRGAAAWLVELASWLDGQTSQEFEHVDRFFIDRVVLDLAAHYEAHAEGLEGQVMDLAGLDREYLRVSTLFCTDISSFQRKQFANLSHAPNKAMNLNVYLGLLGGEYATKETSAGTVLRPALGRPASLVAPRPDYVLTLDADSAILSDYIVELVDAIEARPEVGVVQTPYRTFPGARSAVERTAGATTDLQYLVHQGSSHFSAAFWVGANALLRFNALAQIASWREEGGRTEKVFIQDATVIEDTGSTLDLLTAGWSVHNYPRPLAFSATPADFGSLAVQRQRWSNGGLIIFPMLLAQVIGSRGRWRRSLELLLRSHYLLSPLIGNTAVFMLLLISAGARSLVMAPLVMLPYFIIYGLDLKRNGYRFGDLFAVSSLNLILMPVNFSGILASISQLLTGRKAAFSRTPKVAGRTSTRARYVLFNLIMLSVLGWYVASGLFAGDVLGSLVPGVSLSLYAYGIYRFIGPVAGAADLLAGLERLLGGPGAIWRPSLAAAVLVAALTGLLLGLAGGGTERTSVESRLTRPIVTDFEALWTAATPPGPQDGSKPATSTSE